MDGEIVVLGFMMLIGQIILMQMWQNNWFKKENFKISKSNVMAQNKLTIRKMEKDMGLTKGKLPKEDATVADKFSGLTALLPALKDLDPEQIKGLADKFLGGGDDYEAAEGEDLIGTILKNVDGDTIKSFLAGLSEGGGEQELISQVP